MNINIRQAEDHDLETIIGLVVKLNEFNRSNQNDVQYENYETEFKNISRCISEIFPNRDENTLYLIAELDNQPVGYAFSKISVSEDKENKSGLLDELFVDESARGLGLGRKLIDESLNWMKEKGVVKVNLEVFSWNINAMKLYEKEGFKSNFVTYEKYL